MSAIKDGGPAFPTDNHYEDGERVTHPGMTLRDYFAAKAMQAYITAGGEGFESPSAAGAWAYQNADNMITARGTK